MELAHSFDPLTTPEVTNAGARILVAVDDEDLQRLQSILGSAGYGVISVTDAESAEYILGSIDADLVITEFPGLRAGGEAMSVYLRGPGNRSERPSLALIRDYARGLAASAVAQGFTAVYARPIVAGTLLPLVAQLLLKSAEPSG